MVTAIEHVRAILDLLSDVADYEIMAEILIVVQVNRRLDDVENGRVVSHRDN